MESRIQESKNACIETKIEFRGEADFLPNTGPNEETLTGQISEFVTKQKSVLKTEQEEADYAAEQSVTANIMQTQTPWTISSIPHAGRRLVMEPQGQKRVDFTHGISEDMYESSFQEREKSLYTLAQEKYNGLIQLFVDTKTDYKDRTYQNIRNALTLLAEEYPRLLYAAGIEKPDAGQMEEKQSRLNRCRNLLDHVYTMGTSYLNKSAGKRRNREFVTQQRNLISRIMSEANDAQLAMERMLLIQQERDYMAEDKSGETMQAAQDDNEIEHLSQDVIDELYFYTLNDPIAKGLAGYQWLNGILRGKYKITDIPWGSARNQVKKALKKINGALNTSQLKSKRLYRGTDLTPAFGDRVQHPESLVGQTFSDKGYLSTTRVRDTASNFIMGRLRNVAAAEFVKVRMEHPEKDTASPILTGDSVLEITSRKGAHSLDISSKSQYKSEAEVLFAPGTPIYIHSMRMEVEEVRIQRWMIEDYIKDSKLKVDINEICPQEWNNVYVKFGIPIYQVEIRG